LLLVLCELERFPRRKGAKRKAKVDVSFEIQAEHGGREPLKETR
jgi:hypothetical protein